MPYITHRKKKHSNAKHAMTKAAKWKAYCSILMAGSKFYNVHLMQYGMVDGLINKKTWMCLSRFVSADSVLLPTDFGRTMFERLETVAGSAAWLDAATDRSPTLNKSIHVEHWITNASNQRCKVDIFKYTVMQDSAITPMGWLNDYWSNADYYPGGSPATALVGTGGATTEIFTTEPTYDLTYPYKGSNDYIKFKKVNSVIVPPGGDFKIHDKCIPYYLRTAERWYPAGGTREQVRGVTHGYLISWEGGLTASSAGQDATDALYYAGQPAIMLAIRQTINAKLASVTVPSRTYVPHSFDPTYIGKKETAEANLEVFGADNNPGVAYDDND